MLSKKFIKLDINNKNFYNILNSLSNLNVNTNCIKIENYINNIFYNFKISFDKSLLYYINKFEKKLILNINELLIKLNDLVESFYNLDKETRFLLEFSKNRIYNIHFLQKKNFINNWKLLEESGSMLGQKMNNIDSVGFYIPSGKALYPSSVFMNLLPAIVSKIKNIQICFLKKNKGCDIILSSIFLCGCFKNIFSIGGSQAIISMYYGNNIIRKVDKICGPGNIYVSSSKKILQNYIGIDMIAGPSEVVIFCDNLLSLENISFDMFSQSEHDKLSQSILISNNKFCILDLENYLKDIISFLYRKNINYNSLINNAIFIKINNFNEAINVINYLSFEHLIICNNFNDYNFLKNIKNSGSIFLGNFTSESFGDYNLGLNHVIPTNRSSRFLSPLGVYSFYKHLNFLEINKKAFNKFKHITSNFSKKEKLYSHFESVYYR